MRSEIQLDVSRYSVVSFQFTSIYNHRPISLQVSPAVIRCFSFEFINSNAHSIARKKITGDVATWAGMGGAVPANNYFQSANGASVVKWSTEDVLC